MIQATIGIYPLDQPPGAAIDRAIAALEGSGLQCEVRSMQTEVLGDDDAVFTALRAAFSAAAQSGGTVMTVTLSNACPLPQ